MRRIVLALAMTAGLAIGTVVPVSALGETSITLNCSDGTSVPLLVDTDTLNALTSAVQAMALYPAGLSCSIIQNPPALVFGHVALAAAGTNPFIVAGGRWQVQTTCEALNVTPPPPPPPPPVFVGSGSVARIPGSWSYWSGPCSIGPAVTVTPTTIFVNIAVNVHQRDVLDPTSFFGTLNETIPTQHTPECGTISERHFTSKPIPGCLDTSTSGNAKNASVRSRVTELSPADTTFPGVTLGGDVNFTFVDNGNPPQPTDQLQGPPEAEPSACPAFVTPDNTLTNGNISVRNPA